MADDVPTPDSILPDLIVGVDLGTTYTGVSYYIPKPGDVTEPPVINKWPARLNQVFNKVPTIIACAFTETTWGFEVTQSDRENGRTLVEEHFKLLLDHVILDEVNSSPDVLITMEDIRKCFQIFLKELYEWTSKELEKVVQRRLQDMKVEYLFSVPATWKERTVCDYQAIIKRAGFGSIDGHTAKIALNEAEAAAVQTAIYNSHLETDGYNRSDIVLVCDAGGGTTDVSLLEVTDFQCGVPQFRQMCRIDGVPVGSVKIDEAFNELVKKRLSHLSCRVNHAASGEEFQSIKTFLGTDRVDLLDDIKIAIPGLDETIEDSIARVSGGEMTFSWDDIKHLFDRLLPGIDSLIDKQLKLLSETRSDAEVNYFILSGGLGSSKYVQRHLEQHYVKNPKYPIADKVKILIANDPQLVVCRGLVLARIHQVLKVEPVISQRCGRASYGFIVDEPYDKKIHAHLKSERRRSKIDRLYYLPGRIRWFIDQNQPVDPTLDIQFTRNVHHKHPGSLEHRIVRFDGELSGRPDKLNRDVSQVCEVSCHLQTSLLKSNMDNVQKQHKFPLFRLGDFFCVTYQIRVGVESASMKFELLFGGETRRDVKDITVDWTKTVNKLVASDRLELENVFGGGDHQGDGESDSEGD